MRYILGLGLTFAPAYKPLVCWFAVGLAHSIAQWGTLILETDEEAKYLYTKIDKKESLSYSKIGKKDTLLLQKFVTEYCFLDNSNINYIIIVNHIPNYKKNNGYIKNAEKDTLSYAENSGNLISCHITKMIDNTLLQSLSLSNNLVYKKANSANEIVA